MEKIAFVCVNYGHEAIGGAQLFAKKIAEKLTAYFEVEVLASQSIDYETRKNYYDNIPETINGVLVKRFPVDKERTNVFYKIHEKFLQDKYNDCYDDDWVENVGPHSPELIDYIKEHKDDYKAFLFVTYEYYHTLRGLPLVKEKSILIPTSHKCDYIEHSLFFKIFNMPKAIVYLTEEEKEMCNTIFHNHYISDKVMGVGIDVAKNINLDDFKKKNKLDNYIIYIGRIHNSKNCSSLFENFIEYKEKNAESNLKLVLIGHNQMEVPNHKDIIELGFLTEEEKFDALAGADLLVLPSKYESLSMVVLEAMAVKTPVLVNSECAVLKGHCDKSNGGFYYKTYEEFENILNFYNKYPNIYNYMKENAHKYVCENYNWESIINGYLELINNIG